MSSKLSNHNQLSLREQYAHEALTPVNTKATCASRDYIFPNEGGAEAIAHHFDHLSEGIGVGCGTERLFFAALHSGAWCQGWVSRDINPRVKAYGDFNLLLLSVTTFQEYASISESVTSEVQLTERLTLIQDKTHKSDLPEVVKQYHLQTLQAYGRGYLTTNKCWRQETQFQACWYHQNEPQFDKLQRYAQEGNIIFTLGEINDLRFLRERTISVVDTSNIHLFSPINVQGEGNFAPRIIWTDQNYEQTTFYSRNYIVANTCQLCESQALKPLLPQLMQNMRAFGMDRYFEYTQTAGWEDELERQCYNHPNTLSSFLGILSADPARYQAFMQTFGERRLMILKVKVFVKFSFHWAYWWGKMALVDPFARLMMMAYHSG
jgi:hypothetical protein